MSRKLGRTLGSWFPWYPSLCLHSLGEMNTDLPCVDTKSHSSCVQKFILEHVRRHNLSLLLEWVWYFCCNFPQQSFHIVGSKSAQESYRLYIRFWNLNNLDGSLKSWRQRRKSFSKCSLLLCTSPDHLKNLPKYIYEWHFHRELKGQSASQNKWFGGEDKQQDKTAQILKG